jgi:hypothetical protein
MTTEIYQGQRTQRGCAVTVNGTPLPPRTDLINFSNNAFDWGFCSAEAKQLALAMLAHHCGGDEQRAIDNYDEFKNLVIAHIPCDAWLMDREYIEQMLRTIEPQNRGPKALENETLLYSKTQITSFKFKRFIETGG